MIRESKPGIGIIGMGPMGQAHAQGILANKQAQLLAIYDPDRETSERAAKKFGVIHACQNEDELLQQPGIDAVIIASPDQMHSEQTIKALEAGKHVLCEKPMALTTDACKAMIAASQRTGMKLMIGQICRFTPAFVLTKKLIEQGTIGDLFFVESEYAHDYSHIPGVGNWRIDPIQLRPPFLGGGCHAVDLLRWVAGNPVDVTAYASRKVLKDWPVDDCTIALLRFPDNVLGKVFVSVGCKRNYTMRSVFYGDRGTIIADNTSPTITVYRDRFSPSDRLLEDVGDHEVGLQFPVSINSHNTYAEIHEFIESIVHHRPIATDGSQGAATVAACLAAVESAAKQEKVVIDYAFC